MIDSTQWQNYARKFLPADVLILLAYAFLTVVFTYPLAFRIGSALPGEAPDTFLYIWNLEWVRHAFFDLGVNPYWTREMYYPSGVSLYLYSLVLGSDLLALPLQFAWGLVSAYMLTTLAMFVLSGYAGYLLALDLVRHRGAAFFAGLAFTFSPYHLAHLGYSHFDLMPLLWLPLFALAAKKLFDRPSVPHLLLALVFLFWVSITDWYYALYALIWLLLYTAYRLLRARTWRPLREAVLLGGVMGLLLAPWLVPMFNERGAYPTSLRGVEEAPKFSADLLSFVTPSPDHPLWGGLVAPLATRFLGGPAERTLFIGYTVLVLVLLGLFFRHGRELFFWTGAALVFVLIALGPVLHVAGTTDFGPNHLPIPLPYALLFQIPILSSVFVVARSISRFGVMVMLSLSMVAAIGLKELTCRLSAHAASAAVLIACLAVGVEFLMTPVITTPAQVPDAIQTLAKDPEAFATLDIPVDIQTGAEAMYFWTVDQKPTLDGYHSRLLPIPLFDGLPSMRSLLKEPEHRDILLQPNPPPAQVLNFFNVRYVVLHKQTAPSDLAPRRAEWIVNNLGSHRPLAEDTRLALYAVPPMPALPLVVMLAQGWYEPEPFADGTVWRWMENDAHVLLYTRQAETVALQLDATSFARPRRAQLFLNGAKVFATQVPYGSIKRVTLPKLALQAGANEMLLHPLEQAEQPLALGISQDPRYFTLAVSQLRVEFAP